MTAKEKAIRAIRALSSSASLEGVMERLIFLASVEKGLQQADTGQTLSHKRVKQKMKKWLK